MPGLVTEATAARLRQLMAAASGDVTQQKGSRGQVPGRRPMLVKCTSVTPAGTGIGAECYPAVVMSAVGDQLLADQPTKGNVWLTVVSGGVSIVPTVGEWYEGLLSGLYDPGSDSRPRVFATPSGGAGAYGEGTPSGTTNITADATWTAHCSVAIPSAGRYLLQGQLSALGNISATPSGQILAHLCDTASPGSEVAAISGVVTTVQVINVNVAGTINLTRVVDVAAPFTLGLEGLRQAGPTWVTSQMVNGHGSRSFVSYLQL